MKAAILHKPHTRVSVEDVDIESPHEGEVLLDIVGAGVDFLWILDLYRQGKIKLDELISRFRPLDEINEAFEDMVQGKVARTVLVFD